MNKKLLILLGISLAANFVLIGFETAKVIYQPDFNDIPAERPRFIPQERMENPVDIQDKIFFKKAFKSALKNHKQDMTDARKEMQDALRAEPFDIEQFKVALQKASSIRNQIDIAVQENMTDILSKMTPQERQRFADKFSPQEKPDPKSRNKRSNRFSFNHRYDRPENPASEVIPQHFERTLPPRHDFMMYPPCAGMPYHPCHHKMKPDCFTFGYHGRYAPPPPYAGHHDRVLPHRRDFFKGAPLDPEAIKEERERRRMDPSVAPEDDLKEAIRPRPRHHRRDFFKGAPLDPEAIKEERERRRMDPSVAPKKDLKEEKTDPKKPTPIPDEAKNKAMVPPNPDKKIIAVIKKTHTVKRMSPTLNEIDVSSPDKKPHP